MKKKKGGRRIKSPPRAEFEYRYILLDMTAEELAEMYGVKPQTIYNWAAKFRKEDDSAQ